MLPSESNFSSISLRILRNVNKYSLFSCFSQFGTMYKLKGIKRAWSVAWLIPLNSWNVASLFQSSFDNSRSRV